MLWTDKHVRLSVNPCFGGVRLEYIRPGLLLRSCENPGVLYTRKYSWVVLI